MSVTDALIQFSIKLRVSRELRHIDRVIRNFCDLFERSDAINAAVSLHFHWICVFANVTEEHRQHDTNDDRQLKIHKFATTGCPATTANTTNFLQYFSNSGGKFSDSVCGCFSNLALFCRPLPSAMHLRTPSLHGCCVRRFGLGQAVRACGVSSSPRDLPRR